MVEFALVALVAFLLLIGAVVIALIVTTQIQLSNAARDAARAAAICGSDTRSSSTTELPDKSGLCTVANLNTYITQQVSRLHECDACSTVTVVDSTGAIQATGEGPQPDSSAVGSCKRSGATNTPYSVHLRVVYAQPLYVPLMGYFFGDGDSNTRTLTADVEATCEQ